MNKSQGSIDCRTVVIEQSSAVQPRQMSMLPYKLKTTKEQLISIAGLVIVAWAMKQLELGYVTVNC